MILLSIVSAQNKYLEMNPEYEKCLILSWQRYEEEEAYGRGVIMKSIRDFMQSYTDDGDEFRYTLPYRMEGDGGDAIAVTYKAAGWGNAKKDYYYVLFTED